MPTIAAASAVHIIHVPLDVPKPVREWAVSLLSPDEAERADRYVHDVTRQRFIAARAALRCALGSRLDVAPQDLRFHYGTAGKPELAPVFGRMQGPTICFNLAHSRDQAMIALRELAAGTGQSDNSLGVDLEYTVNPHRHLLDISRSFSNLEQTALRALPDAQRYTGFFHCWVRKEAFLKALGSGIPGGLDRFSVSLEPDEARLLEVDPLIAPHGEWSLSALRAPRGFVAALCVAGAIPALTTTEWQWER